MKAEQAKQLTHEAVERLENGLKQGKSEELKRFLGVLAKFHRYSFGNVLLIMQQRPDAEHVAGFNTWKSMGRYVKQGEKGIAILAPMMLKARGEERAPVPDAKEQRVLRFRVVHVFDVSQTEGEPMPAFPQRTGEPGAATDLLRAFIASKGIVLEHAAMPMGVDGSSSGGRIQVRVGLEPADEFGVLAHELAHELLHCGEGERPSKTVRETEAEAVAFVVCSAVGLHNGTASSDYIQLYHGDAGMLGKSLDRIQKTAAAMIEAVVGQPETEPAA